MLELYALISFLVLEYMLGRYNWACIDNFWVVCMRLFIFATGMYAGKIQFTSFQHCNLVINQYILMDIYIQALVMKMSLHARFYIWYISSVVNIRNRKKRLTFEHCYLIYLGYCCSLSHELFHLVHECNYMLKFIRFDWSS